MNKNILELGALVLAVIFFILIYFLKKKKVDFSVLTILAVGLGIIVGLIFKENYLYLEAIGTIYANLISAIVVPLLLFSIISSITNLQASIKLKKVSLKTIIYLLLNTFTASLITLILAVITRIGSGFNYELSTNYKATEVPSFVDTIIGLFPKNLINSWLNGEVVPIVIFAIIVAIAYNRIVNKDPKKVKPFKQFIDAGNRVLGEVVNFVIGFTPYAVLALIARAVSKSTIDDIIPLLSILGLAYLLSIIQIFGVESILLKVIGKLDPINFFKGIWPAGVVAFTSQSSIGTIPVTIRQLVNKIGVNEDIASFTASLGANLGMPGCAGIWPTLLAVFAINVLNIDYTIGQYLFLVVLAVVVSIGTVGVPGTATITATAVFAAAGLPIEIIVLLAPISSIVDMARTATNVIGAATVATLVAKSEKELNMDIYNGI
ncbi:dicarboxylate/amino acid:cation symporter [Thomasclavelia saccharogumia]|uniref:dicarboxylate/amino acid:cation symporter n=1 Tax=Thomasclavelia saccharogumia TaxID=341225 RepID=UPI00047AFB3C|nr:dicarboxylate/amino acid:cation symporter [Thomasclavelia saccharogumia]